MQAYLEGKVSCQEEKAETQQGSEEAASVTYGQSGRGEVSTQPWLSALSQPSSPNPGNTPSMYMRYWRAISSWSQAVLCTIPLVLAP